MILRIFTLIHVVISLLGILSGFVVRSGHRTAMIAPLHEIRM